MKEKLKALSEKIRPITDSIFNEKSAKVFRITYSVIWNFILIFIIFIILGASLGAGVGAGYFASLVKDEKPRSYESMKKDIYNYEEPSELYFADETLVGTLRSDIIREEVSIDEISDYIKKAVISTEDENFNEHKGVVPKAVFRALFQEVTGSANQSGGSTLTQQLIKNQILTNEVSFERKAKEILLALRLEKFFEKDEILEAYLNVSTFGRNSSGQNIAGVQAAAKGIFGVDAKDLSLPQAAFIAGLPQSPFGYTPFTREGKVKSEEGLKPGLNRQKTVLKRMLEEGAISKKEYDEALKYDIVKDFIPAKKSPMEKYPYLTMESEKRAIDILMELHYKKDGYSKEDIVKSEVLSERYQSLAYRDLRQNGYKIYTTIDKQIYDKWQEIVENFNNYAPSQKVKKKDPDTGKMIEVEEPIEIGASLIENKTGRIISFIGGRDYKRENLNHATQAYRSNGSTMKPLVVYGPAIDMGLAAPGTVIADVDLGLKGDGGRPWPNNFSRRYYGLTSARTALTHSYNVSAVSLMQKIMPHNPGQYLEKMGFEKLTKEDYSNLSVALGSAAHGVTVEENTNAFATFANDGNFIDAYLIEKIVDKEGNVVYEHESEPVEVFSPQAAYLTYDMMRDVVRKGTARSIPGRLKFSTDLAGKTGTSTDTKDKWFVGLNPNVTLGIWTGYDTPKTIPKSYESAHLPLWAQLMNATYDINPELVGAKDRLNMPGGIVKRSYCGISGLLPSEGCSRAGFVLSDYFIAKYVPTEVDKSLISGKYVTIGNKKYLALDSTPSEFAQSGLMLNPDFIKEIAPYATDLNQLLPESNIWAKVLIPSAKMEDNGKIPAAIQISLSGNTITWKAHPENDVIGYRVYQFINGSKGSKVASIHAGSSLSYSLPGSGEYVVTAVDIAGNESPVSNPVSRSTQAPPPNHDGGNGNSGSPNGNNDGDDSGNQGNGNGNNNGNGGNNGNDNGGTGSPPDNNDNGDNGD